MSSIFSSVEVLKLPRSRFKFRKTRRATYTYGKIYPCFLRNITPGETLKITMQNMVKVQPMAAPSMTPQRMDYHFFFVPYRLLDEYFCKGYVGVSDVDFTYDGVDYKKGEEFPYQFPIWSPSSDDLKIGSMWDYCGFGINVKDLQSVDPTDIPAEGDINTPFYLGTNAKGVEPSEYIVRAYNLIYNTMYRDESLCDEVDIDSKSLQYRSYRPDYFTKALPFQQIPSDVTFALPFQISTEVVSSLSSAPGVTPEVMAKKAQIHQFYFDGANRNTIGAVRMRGKFTDDSTGSGIVAHATGLSAGVSSPDIIGADYEDISPDYLQKYSANPKTFGMYLNTANNFSDLFKVSSSATSQVSQALTVAETRNAFQLLKEAERTSRTGYRIDEYIKAHWGEFPGDARMQLPEFIGGMKVPILIGDSIQTSASPTPGSAGTAQGNRVGIGNAVGASSTHWYHATEPGIVIGLCSILPRSEYMQGIPKMWQLHDRYDFPRHEFCCLSEQPVKTGELVLSSSDNNTVAESHNNANFGFQGIYNEYRTGTDDTVGQMRTIYQYWHQTRIFDPSMNELDGKPSTRLNSDFIEAKSVSLRTFLNEDKRYDPFNVEEVFVTDTIMPITKRAVPGLTDHF